MPHKVNTVGNVSGNNITINQIYAPAATLLHARSFNTIAEARPFSVDWFIFSQRSVPFFSREPEVKALTAFLDAPHPFRWWAIVGDGGSGKSRLALEMTERLPDGWKGGFLREENITLRDAAVWRPDAHYLWVVDYAASHHSSLSRIIGAWEQLLRHSPFKVRLLLIERGYSDAGGWWSELTGAMNSNRAAVINTLHERPLNLTPLTERSRAFLERVGDRLGGEMRSQLVRGLVAIDDTQLTTRTQFGNPLLLLLLAADILAQGANSPYTDSPDVETLVERHLGRELTRIKAACDGAGLNYQSMLRLLFATASMYPVGIAGDNDFVIVRFKDQILAFTDGDGKHRLPTFAEAQAAGINLDAERRAQLENLARVVEVTDVALYLDVLAEAGFGQLSHYSIQPDLVGETLVRLLLNAAGVKIGLKRHRGDIDGRQLARLIDGCSAMSLHNCASNWARLDGDALLALADHTRRGGKSIRFALVNLRAINARRSTKAPFDPERVFAPNDVHVEALRVGRYFAKVLDALSQTTINEDSAKHLAGDPDAWVLPYVDFLLVLSPLQRALLGLLICQIRNRETLSRLTNLDNFLFVVSSAVSAAFEDGSRLSEQESNAYARLVEAAFEFCRGHAYPVLEPSPDASYKEPYRHLASAMIECSYAVLTGRLGRDESGKSRRLALGGLDVARKALGFAADSHLLALVERNSAALRVADLDGRTAAFAVYGDVLNAMIGYANASNVTATVLDALRLEAVRGGAEAAVITAHRLLERAPLRLLIGEQIVPLVVKILGYIRPEGHARIADALFSLARILLELMCASTSEDACRGLETILVAAIINTTLTAPKDDSRLSELFATACAWMGDGGCSPSFMTAVLAAVASRCAAEGAVTAAELPLRISVKQVERTIWKSLLQDSSSSDLLPDVEGVLDVIVEFSPTNSAPIAVRRICLAVGYKTPEARNDELLRMGRRLTELLCS